jgi:uncharacterized protein YbcC (UPF0753/DUF2309 family)
MEKLKQAAYGETQRMRLRSLIRLSSEIIAHYWPMRSFVHHNPLHGLERLHFEEAVRLGDQLLDGKGYLSDQAFREYFRNGRILREQIEAVLKPLARDKYVLVGKSRVGHLDVLRVCLLDGIRSASALDEGILQSMIDESPDRSFIETLANHLDPVLKPPALRERIQNRLEEDRTAIGRRWTLSDWCDRVLGAQIRDRTNVELIKWCEAFLDEGHAAWPMPDRDKGFYLAWKALAALEWSPCGIPMSRQKINRLPEHPEDALIENLMALGIPEEAWQEYLSLHLTALPGWTGFIKWRADQTDYEWQQAYPADLGQYLAVRLWYERELVEKNCIKELGISGNVDSILSYMQKQENAYSLKRERIAGRLPGGYAAAVDRIRYADSGQENKKNSWDALFDRFASENAPLQDRAARRAAAWRLLCLAESLKFDKDGLIETPPEDLKILLDWIDRFPESERGPVWLKAFEAGYQEKLLAKLSHDSSAKELASGDAELSATQASPVRPQTQAVFCIDVRSEPFRRHLEAVGDHETFGFAGFFTVFIRYRGLGSDHETDQLPVIMKAKNAVRELPRTYQDRSVLSRHRARNKLLHMKHELLHDLKENVITPYVMVESVGWFYSLPLIGKTVFSSWYRNLADRLRRVFAPPVATTLTIDKLSREEVEEMLASEQRAVIRRALQQQFGNRDLNLSLERLEGLRRRALDETPVAPLKPVAAQGSSRPYALSPEEETAFIEELRHHHRMNRHWAFARMERITRTGFTLNEQIFTVDTALRMMGLTRNFSRLILFCGHGSSSDNNPFEAALDCGACGGNAGKPNARVLAAMANKLPVREGLAKNGIVIPADTFFIAGQHNTTTDEVEVFDLEDLPPTHRRDLHRLMDDLNEAGLQNNRERCKRFPEIQSAPSASQAMREAHRRSGDWSQVRPEWGLSGNAAFIIGRSKLIRKIDLEGRVFLQSYDYQEDPTGKLLEIVMTGPQVVGQWINMEHYFSTVDGEVYGSGSKIYHNVVGRFGVMSGPQSDLRIGLAAQTVMNGPQPYHEPMRMISLIEAPRDRISQIIVRHKLLQQYYDNEWVRLIALDPNEKMFYLYTPKRDWAPLETGPHVPEGKNA